MEIDICELMNIIHYGTDFGARAINEDLRSLVKGKITKHQLEGFISNNLTKIEGYGDEDVELCRETFKDLLETDDED